MLPGMDSARFLECLRADAERLRAAASKDLRSAVPNCPGWSVTELVEHVAEVYLHKVECMRRGAAPEEWPPDRSGEDPLALFDRGLDELLAEFGSRSPRDASFTWYPPDQTVGFWIRRMAQETAVHRVDAEQAAGASTPVPPDLAEDGIDEVLRLFLVWETEEYMTPGEGLLAEPDDRPVSIGTPNRSWTVRLTRQGAAVTDGAEPAAAASVRGEPSELLLWLWGRGSDGSVQIDGDGALLAQLRKLLVEATQ